MEKKKSAWTNDDLFKNDWPTFVPYDPLATCFRCGEHFGRHGLKVGHCPPCAAEVSKIGKDPVRYCTKVAGHKGKCKYA